MHVVSGEQLREILIASQSLPPLDISQLPLRGSTSTANVIATPRTSLANNWRQYMKELAQVVHTTSVPNLVPSSPSSSSVPLSLSSSPSSASSSLASTSTSSIHTVSKGLASAIGGVPLDVEALSKNNWKSTTNTSSSLDPSSTSPFVSNFFVESAQDVLFQASVDISKDEELLNTVRELQEKHDNSDQSHQNRDDSQEQKHPQLTRSSREGDSHEEKGEPDTYYSPLLPRFGTLLDVGAGSGRITSLIAPLFTSVTATEVSDQMCKQLSQKGFTVIKTADIDHDIDSTIKYDVVALFNVLDRCDKPRTLLQSLRRRLRNKDSRLVLAVPLPLRPAVETGNQWLKPTEYIAPKPCYCQLEWEQSLEYLIRDVIIPAGLNVHAVSRVPYLSEGNLNQSYYVLEDCLLVLSRNDVEVVVDGDDRHDSVIAKDLGQKNEETKGNG